MPATSPVVLASKLALPPPKTGNPDATAGVAGVVVEVLELVAEFVNPNLVSAWFKMLAGKLAALKAVATVAASSIEVTAEGLVVLVEFSTGVGFSCLVLIKVAKRRSAILYSTELSGNLFSFSRLIAIRLSKLAAETLASVETELGVEVLEIKLNCVDLPVLVGVLVLAGVDDMKLNTMI
jgi:hypothetical protein